MTYPLSGFSSSSGVLTAAHNPLGGCLEGYNMIICRGAVNWYQENPSILGPPRDRLDDQFPVCGKVLLELCVGDMLG